MPVSRSVIFKKLIFTFGLKKKKNRDSREPALRCLSALQKIGLGSEKNYTIQGNIALNLFYYDTLLCITHTNPPSVIY